MQLVDFADAVERRIERVDVDPHQFNVRLFDADIAGTSLIVGDRVRFPTGFEHHLHRHPHADQILIVMSGATVAYGPEAELEVRAGRAVIFRAGEWHGLRAAGGASAINLFSGVGTAEAAGYESAAEAG